jgi:hypothetical protein
VAFFSAAGGALANVAFGSSALPSQRLPPTLCGAILDQTYGALQGWTPSERQLRAMCKGLLVQNLKVVRNAASASAPCHSFAAMAAAEVMAYRNSGSGLPPLPLLKEHWCQLHRQSQAPIIEKAPLPPTADNSPASLSDDSIDETWPSAPADQVLSVEKQLQNEEEVPRRTMLTSVAASVVNAHHHHRHKVLRQVPLDPAMMLKLREDLLAGRGDIPSVDGSVTQGGTSPSGAKLQTLQISSVVSVPQATLVKEASTSGGDAAAHPGAPVPSPVPAGTANHLSMAGFLSSSFAWLRGSAARTLDFICDGRCGELGVQPRKAQALIVN